MVILNERPLLTYGNHKLSKRQAIWTLPAGITCLGAGECAKWCYSRKAERCYKNVRESRLWKLAISKDSLFVPYMTNTILNSGRMIVRIHQDGDFYSQEYLEKWKEVARLCPDVRFYAFTKSFELDLWTDLPENLVIIQSYGSRYDEKIDAKKNTARVVDDISEVKKGEYLCPYHKKTFTKCGESCNYCFRKSKKVKHVVFLKH